MYSFTKSFAINEALEDQMENKALQTPQTSVV